MSVDKRTIGHLETLARIELTPAERKRLTIELDRIVAYLKQLHRIDTNDVTPANVSLHPLAPTGEPAPRRDVPGGCLDRDRVLEEAPDSDGRFFRVPRIIER